MSDVAVRGLWLRGNDADGVDVLLETIDGWRLVEVLPREVLDALDEAPLSIIVEANGIAASALDELPKPGKLGDRSRRAPKAVVDDKPKRGKPGMRKKSRADWL
jgi:hypothetical protein